MFLAQSTEVFSGVFCETFRNTFIYRTPLVTEHPLQGKSMDWFLYNRDFSSSGILKNSHSENYLYWRVLAVKLQNVCLQFYHESSVFLGIFFFFLNRYLAKLCTAASAFTQSYAFPCSISFDIYATSFTHVFRNPQMKSYLMIWNSKILTSWSYYPGYLTRKNW